MGSAAPNECDRGETRREIVTNVILKQAGSVIFVIIFGYIPKKFREKKCRRK